jgi:RNA:NAD 2'-phosphotransferase (TPT1/KptA family)
MSADTKSLERTSKRMSKYLRHQAGKDGLRHVDAAGWADITYVADICSCSVEEVRAIATPGEHNKKDRFEVDGQRIRARQGHSLATAAGAAVVKSELIHTPLTSETLTDRVATRRGDRWWVVHGTSFGRIKHPSNLGFTRDPFIGSPTPRMVSIASPGKMADEVGLSRMGRSHIHMSPSNEVERWHKWYNLEIWVDIEAAMAAGIKFWISGNDVVLSEGNEHGVIPSRFLHPVALVKATKPTKK